MGLLDQIVSVESGGNPAAKNPNSSASGLGQFIDSTWLSMLAKHRPDLTGSPQELLAMRSDPELSKQMVDAYAKDNEQTLTGAGHQATPGNVYLAHFAGPQGAVSVLNADPKTPVGDVLGAKVVKANPFLAGMTTGDLTAWASRKMGSQNAAPQNNQITAPTGIVPPISPQAAPTVSPQPSMAASPAQMATSAQAQGGSLMSQIPVEQVAAPPPIFAPPRKPINLAALKAAMASGNRGFFNARG